MWRVLPLRVVVAPRMLTEGGCRGGGNDSLYPVLKHGPRSLTRMRVRWWQTTVRNESDDRMLRGCTIDRPLGYGLEV